MGLISRVSSRTYRCYFEMAEIPSYYHDQRSVQFSINPEWSRFFHRNFHVTQRGDLWIGDWKISVGFIRGLSIGLAVVNLGECLLNLFGYELCGFSIKPIGYSVMTNKQLTNSNNRATKLCVILFSSLITEIMFQNGYFRTQYTVRF